MERVWEVPKRWETGSSDQVLGPERREERWRVVGLERGGGRRQIKVEACLTRIGRDEVIGEKKAWNRVLVG